MNHHDDRPAPFINIVKTMTINGMISGSERVLWIQGGQSNEKLRGNREFRDVRIRRAQEKALWTVADSSHLRPRRSPERKKISRPASPKTSATPSCTIRPSHILQKKLKNCLHPASLASYRVCKMLLTIFPSAELPK